MKMPAIENPIDAPGLCDGSRAIAIRLPAMLDTNVITEARIPPVVLPPPFPFLMRNPTTAPTTSPTMPTDLWVERMMPTHSAVPIAPPIAPNSIAMPTLPANEPALEAGARIGAGGVTGRGAA